MLNWGIPNYLKYVKWRNILGAGFIASIGFTMSLFITNLAFTDDQEMVKIAKISILIASLIAAVTGIIILISKGKKSE
ncbi:MAG: Na+/H+ antiporter NhaA [Marinoscillum sp.]